MIMEPDPWNKTQQTPAVPLSHCGFPFNVVSVFCLKGRMVLLCWSQTKQQFRSQQRLYFIQVSYSSKTPSHWVSLTCDLTAQQTCVGALKSNSVIIIILQRAF